MILVVIVFALAGLVYLAVMADESPLNRTPNPADDNPAPELPAMPPGIPSITERLDRWT